MIGTFFNNTRIAILPHNAADINLGGGGAGDIAGTDAPSSDRTIIISHYAADICRTTLTIAGAANRNINDTVLNGGIATVPLGKSTHNAAHID